MSSFNNVDLVKKANIYFDGNVTSRAFTLASGETKTMGIMMPGEYTFGTEQKELMQIQAGEVEVKLAGTEQWSSYSAGSEFEVEANSSFDIKVKQVTDYICSYFS